MSNIVTNELVFMLPTTDEGKARFKGSVKVNYKALNLSHGVRLRMLPSMEFINSGGQGHGSGFTGSSPSFSPVVVQLYLDGSAMQAYQLCATGTTLGEVAIYQLVAAGKDLTVLSTYVLEHTYIAKWFMHFDAPTDQQTGDGIVVTLVLVCTAITVTQTQFDEKGDATGKSGTQASVIKESSEIIA